MDEEIYRRGTYKISGRREMLTFQVPIVYVNEGEGSLLSDKQTVIVTEDAAERIVEQYNSHPEEIAPVKIGPSTIAVVRSVVYNKEKKCIMAEIIFPFGFMGAIYPLKDLQVGNKRRLIDGKLVGVKMVQEEIPTQKGEKNGV